MNTVTFSDKNSYSDFGLILKSREIGEVEPRTNYIDVPARDGLLDITEAFGEVKYKNRPLVFTFEYIGSDANWQPTMSALNNYINGQKHKIYFEHNYYWVGRCFVGSVVSKRGIREVVVECNCEPYKYKLEETIVETGAIETIRTNLFNYADSSTYNLTNNNDGTFTLNTTGYYGAVSVAGGIFEIGKTYTFSQFVNSLQDSESSELEYRVLMYYADDDYIANSVIVDGANKSYSLQLTPTKTVTSVDIMVIFKGNDTTTVTGVISNIKIEEAADAYGEVTKTIINDRKTVTPKVTVIAGEPILSWTDKKTGTQFNGVALPNNFDNKILDLKLYEGSNEIKVVGGSIRLTFREASL